LEGKDQITKFTKLLNFFRGKAGEDLDGINKINGIGEGNGVAETIAFPNGVWERGEKGAEKEIAA
jgi:hypothetical protein